MELRLIAQKVTTLLTKALTLLVPRVTQIIQSQLLQCTVNAEPGTTVQRVLPALFLQTLQFKEMVGSALVATTVKRAQDQRMEVEEGLLL